MRVHLAALAASLVLAGCASGLPGFGGGHHGSPARAAAAGPPSAEMQAHLQRMEDLRHRMAIAQTAQEREALREEHFRLMQEAQALRGGRMGMGRGMGASTSGTASGDGTQAQPGTSSHEGLDRITIEREVERSPGP